VEIRSKFGGRVGKFLFSCTGTQFLRHEIVLVSGRAIFKCPKYPVSELLIKWSRLKTEGVE
jgi:hypothetical protein